MKGGRNIGTQGARAVFPYLRSRINLFIFFKFVFKSINFWLRCVFVAVHGLLIVVASLVAEHGL